MGEDLGTIRTNFNGSLRIESRPERLTGEAGALLTREIMERSGLIRWLAQRLQDTRKPELITHPLSELVMTTLLLLVQGWRDRDDADPLREDPLLRIATSERRGISPLSARPREPGVPLNKNPDIPDGLASQPTLSRLVRMLSTEPDRAVLRQSLFEGAASRLGAGRKGQKLQQITLDLDSIPIEVFGQQPGSQYNGHYHARIYHPLVCSIGETGDMLDAKLRPGSVHTAQGDLDMLLPLIEQADKRLAKVVAVRVDAGFPDEPFLFGLENIWVPYVARVKNNPVLDRMAAPYLKRSPGRPSTEPRERFYEMSYQAESWSRSRRVVLVVIERAGELIPDHFWLITSWTAAQRDGATLLQMYRQRGTAEGHQGELKSVLEPALSSSPRPKRSYRGQTPKKRYPSGNSFAHNEVLLLLNLVAYNLMHVARTMLESHTKQGWSLKRLRERVLRLPARVLIHGRRAVVVIGQAAAGLWQGLWNKLMRWQVQPAP
jgi:hypothetical protein